MTPNELPDFRDAPPPAADEAFLEKARRLRPFYFIVVVWGERYTDFLLDFCIPSLLSPGNIPALANRGRNKFLIATTDEDWQRIERRPIFGLLREYVEPVKIPIPPCPPGLSGCVHMGVGHKLATHMAFEDRAYAVLLTPDLMLSDGSIAAVQRHALAGRQVVLVAALRFGEEPLFEHLEKLGVVGSGSRRGDEARPIVASGRQLVWAGIRSFHSETLRYEWEAPYFSEFPVACWWRVPGEDGIIVHSLSWAPLLVDYAGVERHDSSVMDHWTIDGDYIYRNFGLDGKVHVVQDSDEIMLVSWAPLGDREQSLEPKRLYNRPLLRTWLKGFVLYSIFTSPVFDALKRKVFFAPVRWHAEDFTPAWSRTQTKVAVLLRWCLSPAIPLVRKSGWSAVYVVARLTKAFHALVWLPLGYLLRLKRLVMYYWTGRVRIVGVARGALRGDPVARQRVKKNLRFFVHQLTGWRPQDK